MENFALHRDVNRQRAMEVAEALGAFRMADKVIRKANGNKKARRQEQKGEERKRVVDKEIR